MRLLRNLPLMRKSRDADPLAEAIDILRKSPLLDPVWYRQNSPDLRDTPIDVARHYLEHGANEGRNPHPLFDTKFYLEQNPDVAASGINPLVHYLTIGWEQGVRPNAIFYPNWYIEQNLDVKEAKLEPLQHYMLRGWRENRRPAQDFDVEEYLVQAGDFGGHNIDPLTHYFTIGRKRGIRPVRIFPLNSSLEQSAVVKREPAEPISQHPRKTSETGRPRLRPGPVLQSVPEMNILRGERTATYAGAEPLIDRNGRTRIILDAAGQRQNLCLVDAFLAVEDSGYDVWCLYPGMLKSWMRPDMLFAEIPATELGIYFTAVDAVILTSWDQFFDTRLHAYLACGVVPFGANDEINEIIEKINSVMKIDDKLSLKERIRLTLNGGKLSELSMLAHSTVTLHEKSSTVVKNG
jgi:hypothetical protein